MDSAVYRDRDLLKIGSAWLDDNQSFASATVISTWGSAPREVGAFMLVDGDGQFLGSVSGGCVENAVVESALASMRTGEACLVEFGVSDDDVLSIGLACGGQIRVLIEPSVGSERHWIGHAYQAIHDRNVSTLMRELDVTNLDRPIVGAEWLQASHVDFGRKTGLDIDHSVFLQTFRPERRAIIIGGVHIAQALVTGLQSLEFDVLVVDPREVWANAERFPTCTIINQWPDDALTDIGIDSETAIIALTHDPKFDDPALLLALNSCAFYVGALGGTKSANSRRLRLLENGLTDLEIDRLQSPVGLSIGAKGPSEITVSILAELISTYRSKR
ncbi:XdhC family protein [Litorivicinus sp.]|nr:XdhC family protein [Litorivicinus sp.]